ncbi:relaxase/mobilization nuclease domain-containing protein [Flavobacterium sp.]|uniref:relaxase/mobilization nuclease domain-containing protein n=1 Tax=Flavobacterium sp. TaxID=239 RepID=UPI002BDD8D60|nr:relaxase/mobilization nuclease domain-containing protein [Flavobacterium sp.]HSD07669.1 relaxase/mobilization nuclease domain-containing protein [Flavobacterium sp.]
MISKAKSCPGGSALFNYVVNEKKGYELARNGLSGTTAQELFQDMAIMQQQNHRCVNNTISIVLSPTINDSRIMNDSQLTNLTIDFLKNLELDADKNQFIAFVHTEKDHKHIHILMNRVKPDGKLIQDNFISKKAQRVAHEVALKQGWTSAKILKESKEAVNKNQFKEVKKLIKDAHYKSLESYPKNLKEYISLMAREKIGVTPTINKQGIIQGYRFLHEPTGVDLKASEVDRNLKLNELFRDQIMKTGESNQIINDYSNYNVSINILSGILQLYSPNTSEEIPEVIKKKRKIFKR